MPGLWTWGNTLTTVEALSSRAAAGLPVFSAEAGGMGAAGRPSLPHKMMELGASRFQVCTLRRKGRKVGETGTLGGALLAVKVPENRQRAVTDRRRAVTPEPELGVIHVANT